MNEHPNRFARRMIAILFAIIAVLILVSFIWGTAKFSITGGMIWLIVLLVFLAVSEVFDNFSVGNLITAQKEKRKTEAELQEAKNENRELRTQMMSIMSNSVSSRNTNIIGLSKDDWVQVLGSDSTEDNDDSAADSNTPLIEAVEGTSNCIHNRYGKKNEEKRLKDAELRCIAIDRFSEQRNISKLSIVRRVKLANGSTGLDPIMEKNAIFEAYHQSKQEELFFYSQTAF